MDAQEPECVLVTPPLELFDGSIEFDLTSVVLEEEDATHDAVIADCGELSAAGDPFCFSRVLIYSEAVGQKTRNAWEK